MQLAMREWRAGGRWRAPLSALAFGLVLGVMGPFGSQSLGPAVKYPFWLALSMVGFAAAWAASRLVPGGWLSGQPAARLAVVAALSALPVTFVVAWATGLVRPGRSFTPLQMLALYPYVGLVQVLIAALLASARQEPEIAAHEPAADPPRYPADFLAKLPAALRRDIIALEAEDHYLRVHTLHGSALVLMRLSDAVALIDPRLGLRVHRSWWVARAGVSELDRASGRVAVRLANGQEVPVSRTHLSAARSLLTN